MILTYRIAALFLLWAWLLWPDINVRAQVNQSRERFRDKVEQIRQSFPVTVEGARIASSIILPALYEHRNFRLAWTNTEAIEQLINAIRSIDKDGLNPEDYHLATLKQLRQRLSGSPTPDPVLLGDLDLLLTDSLIRLDYHILFGKVDPEALDPTWNLSRDLLDINPVMAIEKAIETNGIAQLVESSKPTHPFYTQLKETLAEYRRIKREGGWLPLPAGPALKLGMIDARVAALRKRLMITGDLMETSSNPAMFDEPLKQAVMAFQERYNLVVDGVAGKDTLQALNVPVGTRIAQLLVNLERGRWVLHEIENDFVLVDIAGFRAMYIQDGKVIWSSRVQVGRPYRKTPVFKSAIRYLVLNPTWTIPPGILAKDILPEVKRNPHYLRQHNINVIDRAGNIVNADTLDWSRYMARNFPYQLRQEPGPNNALGRIKFIFPNPHFVYLHDTPSKSLFRRANRTFSSGCIRVEKPLELAELLLDDPAEWDQEKIAEAIASQETRTVFLPRKLPILLLYWTVSFDEHGRIGFKRDVYNRDKAVLKGLRGGFKFRKRPVIRPTSF